MVKVNGDEASGAVTITLGEPLSEEQQKRFAEAIDEARKTIERFERDAREAPHRHFIEAAMGAGFTHGQAEFLWMVTRTEPRLF